MINMIKKYTTKYEIKDDKLDRSYFYFASNKDESLKNFYSSFLRDFFEEEYHELRNGIITNTERGESHFYTFKLVPKIGLSISYKDMSEIKFHGGIKDEYVGRKLLYVAWIPASIVKQITYPKIKEISSIFDIKISGNLHKLFMYNAKTKQLLLWDTFSSELLYDKYAVEKDKNPYNDFVIGNISKGKIFITEDLSEVMKVKDTSDMIVKTLNMFKMNGANDNYILRSAYSEKKYKLGYFLKTKVLW